MLLGPRDPGVQGKWGDSLPTGEAPLLQPVGKQDVCPPPSAPVAQLWGRGSAQPSLRAPDPRTQASTWLVGLLLPSWKNCSAEGKVTVQTQLFPVAGDVSAWLVMLPSCLVKHLSRCGRSYAFLGEIHIYNQLTPSKAGDPLARV